MHWREYLSDSEHEFLDTGQFSAKRWQRIACEIAEDMRSEGETNPPTADEILAEAAPPPLTEEQALAEIIGVIALVQRETPAAHDEPKPDDPFALYAMDDSEWAEIQPFMLPQVGRVIVDWRNVCDKLLARFNYGQHGCPWSALPNSSTVRMAFRRANDAGVWACIGAALPTLNVRREAWANVVRGAEVAAGARRSRA